MCYLGLLTRPAHPQRNLEMIGNREVTESARKSLWKEYQQNKEFLPEFVMNLIESIDKLNSSANVGFRRRNLPALLGKYFIDMRKVLIEIKEVLKPGAPAYIVIGNNHTIAGGQRVDIDTSLLLAEIAEQIGLIPKEHIPMEMLVSRDIFRRNAVASETILSFNKSL